MSDEDLFEDYIIPTPLHPEVYPKEARAVAEQAIKNHVARRKVSGEWIEKHTRILREFYSTLYSPCKHEERSGLVLKELLEDFNTLREISPIKYH